MTRRLRTIGAVLVAVAAVLALLGTGGFTASSADRAVAAETVGDDRALVGYDSPDEIGIEYAENETNTTDNGTEEVTLVVVTNRFESTVEVTDVDVDPPDGLDVEIESRPGSLSPDESAAVEATLSCEDSFEDERLSAAVDIAFDDVSVEIPGDTATRSVSVTCGADP
jgi:hypothetical protein